MSSDVLVETERIVDKLASLGNISNRKMFGGVGLFEDSKMFGIIDSSGNLFLKSDDTNRDVFEAAHSEKHGRMPYYSVPDDIGNDDKKLSEWAKTSIKVAHSD